MPELPYRLAAAADWLDIRHAATVSAVTSLLCDI
jgi:hypothetical protein